MFRQLGHRSQHKKQQGAVIPLVAVLMVVLLGFVALAIDIGYLVVTRNELQNVADASALAAGRKLGSIYQGMTYEEQQAYVCDPAPIIAVAQEVGLSNVAATESITINSADIEIGDWSSGVFAATLNKPNAVRVTARRDSEANNPISTFFAMVLGIDTLDVSAIATAALTGQSSSAPGELELPVGISRAWFESHPGVTCGEQIKFYPTTDPDACAGWTTFDYAANTPNLEGILDGDIISTSTSAGVTDFNYTGGVVAASFPNLILLFKRKGFDVTINDEWIYNGSDMIQFATEAQGGVPLYLLDDDGNQVLDVDGNPIRLYYPEDENDPDYPPPAKRPRNKHAWETSVVVYANPDGTADCDNPNKTKPIVGYARIRLTNVLLPPDGKLIVGVLICDYTGEENTRSGGGESFGLMGSIPGLVQ
jgi:Flp pilus assembly protein TadG